MTKDIRWLQRFQNFKKAFNQLKYAVNLFKEKELSLLEKQGVIQAFEFTHELSWKLLKDYLEYQGNFEIRGSRDAIKESFNVGLINNAELWLESISMRNLTSHAYDESILDSAIYSIVYEYYEQDITHQDI